MSQLRVDKWSIDAAALGVDNPLPNFHYPSVQPVLSDKPIDDATAGYLPNYLPYTMQDGYTRDRYPTEVKVAVLENQHLKATFLLDYGGRLWSLIHKLTGRELLYVNAILQPANLAVRNAWFSGGVEWNMGVIGHTPFTCSPIFAARVMVGADQPVLRLYEWERIRQVAYQIDAYLPDDSEVLLVRVRLVNPFAEPVPMYWWSNIAVPEAPDVRVLTPASTTFQYALTPEDLKTVNVPVVDGVDISYSTHGKRAADYFFHIPPQQRAWITALNGQGQGLAHISTDLLHGRKLFLWGTAAGGQRWQRWLSDSDQAYLEIQAGLATTQLEYVTMPPHAEWEWLEAYGLLATEPQAVHGNDWPAACTTVEQALESLIPRAKLDQELERSAGWKDQPPSEVLQHGSGWGALELIRREHQGMAPFAGAGLNFSEALGTPQQAWLTLLETGRFPNTHAHQPQAGLLVQDEWQHLLEQALAAHPDSGWEAWLHLGTMRLHQGDLEGAQAAWQTSLERQSSAWALRNLAVVAQHQQRLEEAALLYREALALGGDVLALWVETARALIDAGQGPEFIALLNAAEPSIQQHGRLRLLAIEAYLAAHDWEQAQRLFDEGFEISDYREGDESLTVLWYQMQAERLSQREHMPINAALRRRVERDYPLPAHFDFRMKGTDEKD